jgi:acetyl esterase/lipase
MFRALFLALAFLAMALMPAAANPVGIMTPFNMPGAMDTGAVKIGEDIPFADGDRFKLDVYAPKNPTGPAPVVMFIYGGAWAFGNKFDFNFVGLALASEGFVTVVPDYRQYPEAEYPAFLDDNAAAAKWVEDNIARFGGDPGRFFLAGHSAGAYNAVMLGLDGSFLREYGVTMPVRGIAAIAGPYDFYPFEYDEVRRIFGDAPNPEGTQPINLVAPEAPPMLLMSGTSDPIVRVENTEHLAEKLRASKDWVTTKYYEGLGHMEPVLSLGALWLWRSTALSDMVAFFTRFGAFPSGAARPDYVPEPPTGGPRDIDAIVARLDQMFDPIAAGHEAEE